MVHMNQGSLGSQTVEYKGFLGTQVRELLVPQEVRAGGWSQRPPADTVRTGSQATCHGRLGESPGWFLLLEVRPLLTFRNVWMLSSRGEPAHVTAGFRSARVNQGSMWLNTGTGTRRGRSEGRGWGRERRGVRGRMGEGGYGYSEGGWASLKSTWGAVWE